MNISDRTDRTGSAALDSPAVTYSVVDSIDQLFLESRDIRNSTLVQRVTEGV